MAPSTSVQRPICITNAEERTGPSAAPSAVAAVALTVIELWHSQNVIAVSAAEAAAMKKAGEARVKGTTSTKED